MKKISNKVKSIIVAGCAAILFVMCICYMCSYFSTAHKLYDTQQKLMVVQNNFNNEVTNVNNLSKELAEVKDELNKANEIITTHNGKAYFIDCEVTEQEIDMIAKTVWGEARGCNKLGQSAVIWCILNRVDAGWGTIAEVITAPSQFHGYNSTFPVDENIRALAIDVIARWKLEKLTSGEVGRTLPHEYLYFSAHSSGAGNVFRTKWKGDYKVWNWNCWNPYE